LSGGPMPVPNQGACQSRKTAKNGDRGPRMGDFANQELGGFANVRVGPACLELSSFRRRY
jgi:hypothetical protein